MHAKMALAIAPAKHMGMVLRVPVSMHLFG